MWNSDYKKGNNYETIQKQKFTTENLCFTFTARFSKAKDTSFHFLGPFVQGPKENRFIYIDIGAFAGQTTAVWSRRLKVPLTGISWEMIHKILADNSLLIETIVPGTGKDGGPNCGTVKPFKGWYLTHSTLIE